MAAHPRGLKIIGPAARPGALGSAGARSAGRGCGRAWSAARPPDIGYLAPLAAQMAATCQRLSGGRLLLNVVAGGEASEQRRFGDHLPHDERYSRTGEFLEVIRGAWSGTPYDFTGTYYQVGGATVLSPPEPVPDVYFGGSSPAAGPGWPRRSPGYGAWPTRPTGSRSTPPWARQGASSAELAALPA